MYRQADEVSMQTQDSYGMHGHEEDGSVDGPIMTIGRLDWDGAVKPARIWFDAKEIERGVSNRGTIRTSHRALVRALGEPHLRGPFPQDKFEDEARWYIDTTEGRAAIIAHPTGPSLWWGVPVSRRRKWHVDAVSVGAANLLVRAIREAAGGRYGHVEYFPR
jgi:hypothetical protein